MESRAQFMWTRLTFWGAQASAPRRRAKRRPQLMFGIWDLGVGIFGTGTAGRRRVEREVQGNCGLIAC